MTNYPNGIDTFTTVKPDDEMLGHASKHNNEAGAIVAVETELGENPSGSFDSVTLRLDGVDAAISSIEIYDDTVLSEAVTKNTIRFDDCYSSFGKSRRHKYFVLCFEHTTASK